MKRLGILTLFSLLFITFIAIWNESYESGLEEAYIPMTDETPIPVIPSEKGVFKRSKYALDYTKMPKDQNDAKTINSYYNNRAFYGAPPYIPHPIVDEIAVGGASCLKCHDNGGYVSKFKAYAPVTPHPEMENCRQCHVVQSTGSLFKGNNFHKSNAPEIGVNNALLGSPPIIPHGIQMRENCLACHAGPAAAKEIRVSHPERSNCLQCHVLNNKTSNNFEIFTRKNTIDE